MTDIVDRLKRVGAERQRTTAHDNPEHYLHVIAKISNADGLLMQEAADEIARLRAALRGILGWLEDPEGGSHEEDMREASRLARAALKEDGDA